MKKTHLTAVLTVLLAAWMVFQAGTNLDAKERSKKSHSKNVAAKSTGSKKASKKSGYHPSTPANIKAIWLSQYDLVDVYRNGGQQRDEASYTQLVTQVLDKVAGDGFNMIIVQVRPNGDSMYPSDVYPMSSFITGAYGREAAYDPFAILVKLAHERNLSVHAWINPMRLMRGDDIRKVPDRYRIKQWLNDPSKNGDVLVNFNGGWFLNPACEEARQLIIDGGVEVLTKYDVDGLHMDDYFYPTMDASFDKAAFDRAGHGMDIRAFRRQEMNKLVAGLYAATKKVNKKLLFGISPAGEFDRVMNEHCADLVTWCKEDGYIDYICPQAYFGLKHGSSPFPSVCTRFQDALVNENIDLIIGMTLGKALSKNDQWAGAAGKTEWAESQDILKRCLEITTTLPKCRGVAYFCYKYFYHPVTGAPEAGTAAERANFMPLLKDAAWPRGEAKASQSKNSKSDAKSSSKKKKSHKKHSRG